MDGRHQLLIALRATCSLPQQRFYSMRELVLVISVYKTAFWIKRPNFWAENLGREVTCQKKMFSQNSYFPFTRLSSLEAFHSLLCSMVHFLLPLKWEYLKSIKAKRSLTSVSTRLGFFLASLPFGSVKCCTSGASRQVAVWKQQSSVPTSPWEWGFNTEREVCTKQPFQLHGSVRCWMLRLNEK